MSELSKLLLQLAVVLAAARAAGALFRLIRQPQVVGEMIAGILLGPSLLGWVAPELSAVLFPAGSLGYLNALSQVGLILFMFLIGLTLEHDELHHVGRAAVVTSHISVSFAFVLGGLCSLVLYPRFSDETVPFLNFALFMGAAMSIAAFPVMARILTERQLLSTRVGTMAIACAAVDDVTGWTTLAQIVILIRATQSATPWWITVGGAITFAVTMLLVVRRLTPWFQFDFEKNGRVTDNALAGMLVLMFSSAMVTDWLGIHQLFGAFLLGAVMPKSSAFVHHVASKFESLTVVLLLPLFFAYTGLRTSIGVLKDPSVWPYALLVLAVAIVGKLGGAGFASRLTGLPSREALALGILMNTRGLMELVILNIGLDIGVISPAVFSMMVVMALVTTFMTSPLLDWVYPRRVAAPSELVQSPV